MPELRIVVGSFRSEEKARAAQQLLRSRRIPSDVWSSTPGRIGRLLGRKPRVLVGVAESDEDPARAALHRWPPGEGAGR